MSRRFTLIHRIIMACIFIILAATLMHFIFVWRELPEEIGMHFGPDGNFDEYESKIYGFYPYVISAVLIPLLMTAVHFVKKINLGLSLDEKGDRLFRYVVIAALDLASVGICVYALIWSYAVEHQQAMNITIMRANLFTIIIGCFLVCPVTLGIINKKYSTKKSKGKDPAAHHKIGRTMCWSFLGISVLFEAVIWERTPADKPTTDPFEYVNYADFGISAPKFMMLLPLLLMLIICITGGVLIKKLGSRKGEPFIRLIDDIRVILVIMLFYRMICDISVSLWREYLFYALLCLAAVIMYIIRKKRSSS